MDTSLKQFLRDNALKWLAIENKVKELKKIIKEKKDEQTKLESDLISIMGEYNIEDLTTQNGNLKYKVSTSKQGLSKKFLLLALGECLGNSEKAVNLFTEIDKKREVKTKAKLTQGKNSVE